MIVLKKHKITYTVIINLFSLIVKVEMSHTASTQILHESFVILQSWVQLKIKDYFEIIYFLKIVIF